MLPLENPIGERLSLFLLLKVCELSEFFTSHSANVTTMHDAGRHTPMDGSDLLEHSEQ